MTLKDDVRLKLKVLSNRQKELDEVRELVAPSGLNKAILTALLVLCIICSLLVILTLNGSYLAPSKTTYVDVHNHIDNRTYIDDSSSINPDQAYVFVEKNEVEK